MILALALSAASLVLGPYVLGYAAGLCVLALACLGLVPAYAYVRTTPVVPTQADSDESIEFVLAELRAKMAAQIERKRVMESKSNIFSGIVVVLTSLALYGIPSGGWSPLTQNGALALLLMTSLLATVGVAIATVWPRQMNVPPDPDRIVVDVRKPVRELRLNMIHSFREAYPENERALSLISGFMRCTAVLLLLDLVLAVVVLSITTPKI